MVKAIRREATPWNIFREQCSRFELESRALALDTGWNREHVLSIRVGIESTCSRYGLASRACALDTGWNREQRLSVEVGQTKPVLSRPLLAQVCALKAASAARKGGRKSPVPPEPAARGGSFGRRSFLPRAPPARQAPKRKKSRIPLATQYFTFFWVKYRLPRSIIL